MKTELKMLPRKEGLPRKMQGLRFFFADFANILTMIKKNENIPTTPVVAKSSRTKLEDWPKLTNHRFWFALKAICLNLVKSVKNVPIPDPKKNPCAILGVSCEIAAKAI